MAVVFVVMNVGGCRQLLGQLMSETREVNKLYERATARNVWALAAVTATGHS